MESSERITSLQKLSDMGPCTIPPCWGSEKVYSSRVSISCEEGGLGVTERTPDRKASKHETESSCKDTDKDIWKCFLFMLKGAAEVRGL